MREDRCLSVLDWWRRDKFMESCRTESKWCKVSANAANENRWDSKPFSMGCFSLKGVCNQFLDWILFIHNIARRVALSRLSIVRATDWCLLRAEYAGVCQSRGFVVCTLDLKLPTSYQYLVYQIFVLKESECAQQRSQQCHEQPCTATRTSTCNVIINLETRGREHHYTRLLHFNPDTLLGSAGQTDKLSTIPKYWAGRRSMIGPHLH